MKKILFCSVATILLTACVIQPREKNLYYWGDYESSMYRQMKHEGFDPYQELDKLQLNQEKAAAQNLPLPPGFYAYLGMLYAQTGKTQAAKEAFNREKTLFPESATYMDFLLKQSGGK